MPDGTTGAASFIAAMLKTCDSLSRVVVLNREGEPLIERVRLKKFPDGSSEVLHIIYRSDSDPLHNHMWDYESRIIYGSYIEHTTDGKAIEYFPGSRIEHKAEEFHRLELPYGPVVTFVRRGPPRQKWCFLTPEGPVESLEWLRRQGIKPHG